MTTGLIEVPTVGPCVPAQRGRRSRTDSACGPPGASACDTRESVALILDSKIFSYLDRIGRCSRSSQVADVLAEEATRIGLSAVACWMLTGPKAGSRNPFYANNWPQPWLDLYLRNGYFEKDPFARWAISSGAAVGWAALMKHLPANDPAHAIRLAARNFGFREGFGTPVRSAAGHLGLFTFFGDRRPLSSGEQIFLQAISPGTLHRMEALAPAAEPARPAGLLSQRERECATLVCEGLSNPAIALRLGITAATVKFHLANACNKLGARSRAHLAGLFRAAPALAVASVGPDEGAVAPPAVAISAVVTPPVRGASSPGSDASSAGASGSDDASDAEVEPYWSGLAPHRAFDDAWVEA